MGDETTELREKLIARGIDYSESQDRFRTRFRFNYCKACNDYLDEIEVMGTCITASKSYLTPEQAITAMFGGEGTGELIDRARDMARNIQGNLGRNLYNRKDSGTLQEVSTILFELANELNSTRFQLKMARDDQHRFIDNMNEMIDEEVLGKCAECAEVMGRYADSLCDPLKQRIAELEEHRDVLLRCLENDHGIKASWDGLRKLWFTESVDHGLNCVENNAKGERQ